MRIYEDLKRISENRLPQRAYYIPTGYKLLNGDWKFKFYSRDIDEETKITEWDTIDVPSCWQARGYEKPYYTNIQYPYPVDPPYVPDAKTIWLFKDTITQKEIIEPLFNQFTAQLELQGIITHTGTIVDATFVDAPLE